MNKINLTEKTYSLLLFGATFLVLLIFAYWFAVERVLFEDASVVLFKILNYKTFYITNYRFISAFIELPVVIGVKLNLSVKVIVYLFSFGYFIPEFIISFLLIFILKDYKNLLVLLLLLTVLNNFDFYYTYAEFHKGINLSVLFLSMLQHKNNFITKLILYYTCLLFLYFIILFCHPLMAIVVLFIFFYQYVENKIDIVDLKRFVFFAVITFVLKSVFFRTGYETQKMKLTITFIKDNILLEGFLSQCIHHNFIFASIFLTVFFFLLVKNKRQLLSVFAAFSFGYFIMICLIFGKFKFDYYGEYLFKPLVFFVAVILVHQFDFKLKANQLLLSVVIIISLSKIYHYRKILCSHTNRYKEILKVMHDNNINKALISNKAYTFDMFDDRWASSFESTLLDKIVYDSDTSSTFYITYCLACNEKDINTTKTFIDNDDVDNPPYFNIPSENYIVIDSLLIK
jgi:hypothetical protein